MNPVHILVLCFLKVNFNIILSFKPRSQVVSSLQVFRLKLCVHFSSLPYWLLPCLLGKMAVYKKDLTTVKFVTAIIVHYFSSQAAYRICDHTTNCWKNTLFCGIGWRVIFTVQFVCSYCVSARGMLHLQFTWTSVSWCRQECLPSVVRKEEENQGSLGRMWHE